ncbi:YaaL family protein [Bacillus sp. CGMCC 1.16541]|uniref:YaaL family protein n=1 Tax=Bacillus sp. CGMCC 1.16541 TaxID=2185143 RepID=UPI000D73E2F0|nr:YaaL family protein [Bacillus sp. CGMCC 1.16541]
MFFKRKGWLRKEFDAQLLETFIQAKDDWSKKTDIINRSVDPSDEVIVSGKIAKAKYLYLLKEAKYRNIKIGRP